MIDWKPLLPAVRQAVELTQRVRQLALTHSAKGVNDPVTIADYGSQAILLRALQRYFPNAAVLAEEHSEQFLTLVTPESRKLIVDLLSSILGEPVREQDVVKWLDFGHGRQDRQLWTVDPIDGTRGYVSGRRYCVAIGILDDFQPVDGLLACPGYPTPDGKGLMLYSVSDGVVAESLGDGKTRRASVRTAAPDVPLTAVESMDKVDFDHPLLRQVFTRLEMVNLEPPQVDGQDKYALIAAGDVDFYLRPQRPRDRHHYIWDHVPGTALVTKAGGQVSDLTGCPLDFSRGERLPTLGLLVSSPRAHERVLEALKFVIDGLPAEDL